MMTNDILCIKEDVCEMAVCDGVASCSHAVLKTAVLAQHTNNSHSEEIKCNKCGKVLPPLEISEGKRCSTGYLCRSCFGLKP